MKWLLPLLAFATFTTQALSEMTLEEAMKEISNFTLPYDSICLSRKDITALDNRKRLSEINQEALSMVARYWYNRAIKSAPEKWLLISQEAKDEKDLDRSISLFLINYYSDHLEEIKVTVDMMLTMENNSIDQP